MNIKYDSEVEKEVLNWIEQLTGVTIERGRENVAANLKDGQILIKSVLSLSFSIKSIPII